MTDRNVTPWGLALERHGIADGIQYVRTGSHGGFLLSDARRAAMEPRFREFETMAGGNWYEHDLDGVLVVMSFPTCFSIKVLSQAVSLYYRHPEYFRQDRYHHG